MEIRAGKYSHHFVFHRSIDIDLSLKVDVNPRISKGACIKPSSTCIVDTHVYGFYSVSFLADDMVGSGWRVLMIWIQIVFKIIRGLKLFYCAE